MVRDDPVSPCVDCLFGHRRPSAVGFFVAKRVVDPINRPVQSWSRTHVFEEGFKRVFPEITDCDATVAVERGVEDSRIEAAPFHRAPASILGRSRSTMSSLAHFGDFSFPAAARFSGAAAKALLGNVALLAAVAAAVPVSHVLVLRETGGFVKNQQTTKAFSSKGHWFNV